MKFRIQEDIDNSFIYSSGCQKASTAVNFLSGSYEGGITDEA